MSGMRIIKSAAAWLKTNPFRIYIVSLALAVLPCGVLIIAAHNVLLHEVTGRLITQSTKTGQQVGNLIEQHLGESTVLLESFGMRPDLLQQAQESKFKEV